MIHDDYESGTEDGVTSCEAECCSLHRTVPHQTSIDFSNSKKSKVNSVIRFKENCFWITSGYRTVSLKKWDIAYTVEKCTIKVDWPSTKGRMVHLFPTVLVTGKKLDKSSKSMKTASVIVRHV